MTIAPILHDVRSSVYTAIVAAEVDVAEQTRELVGEVIPSSAEHAGLDLEYLGGGAP